ncbi:unnamed protein product [Trichobilharzia regenti]|nr:unnamed protein product [Trichobilharzia regenti]
MFLLLFFCFFLKSIYIQSINSCALCVYDPIISCHLKDRDDSVSLLCKDNVDKLALQAYARETASYVTNGSLTRLDFALNSRGEPDVDAFDFTKMFAAEYSCNILEKNHCLLLQCLIGDGLYEVSAFRPFIHLLNFSSYFLKKC